VVKPVSVKEYGIKLPGQLKEFWSGEMLSTKDGQFSIPLKAHESKVYVWS
jgi:hypothetical protein